MPDPEATFFRTPADWRAWLEAHAAEATHLWVGFHKRGSHEPGITWPESVDQALCFGWIDGRRQSIDAVRYRIRFSPRKAGSIWSTVNVARVAELGAQGLMQPAGLEAFARRRENRVRHLLPRTGRGAGARACGRGAPPRAARGLGLLLGAGAVLSQGGAVVGRERQARRHAGAAPGHARRRLGRGSPGASPPAARRPRMTANMKFSARSAFSSPPSLARARLDHIRSVAHRASPK